MVALTNDRLDLTFDRPHAEGSPQPLAARSGSFEASWMAGPGASTAGAGSGYWSRLVGTPYRHGVPSESSVNRHAQSCLERNGLCPWCATAKRSSVRQITGAAGQTLSLDLEFGLELGEALCRWANTQLPMSLEALSIALGKRSNRR